MTDWSVLLRWAPPRPGIYRFKRDIHLAYGQAMIQIERVPSEDDTLMSLPGRRSSRFPPLLYPPSRHCKDTMVKN